MGETKIPRWDGEPSGYDEWFEGVMAAVADEEIDAEKVLKAAEMQGDEEDFPTCSAAQRLKLGKVAGKLRASLKQKALTQVLKTDRKDLVKHLRTLRQSNNPQNKAHRLAATRQLLNLQAEGGDVKSFTGGLERLFHNRLGAKIDADEVLLTSLLAGVPPQYSAIADQLIHDPNATYEIAKDKLIAHATFLDLQSTRKESNVIETAAPAVAGNAPPAGGKKKKKKKKNAAPNAETSAVAADDSSLAWKVVDALLAGKWKGGGKSKGGKGGGKSKGGKEKSWHSGNDWWSHGKGGGSWRNHQYGGGGGKGDGGKHYDGKKSGDY